MLWRKINAVSPKYTSIRPILSFFNENVIFFMVGHVSYYDAV